MEPKRRPGSHSVRQAKPGQIGPKRRKPYQVQAHVAAPCAGINVAALNALSDDLEDAERIRSLRPRE
jgi:hypothetical protein